ncbi:hypothetical protein D3C84_1307560 [compost metagenome]
MKTDAMDRAMIVPVMPNAQPSLFPEINHPASRKAVSPRTAIIASGTPRTSNTSVIV